MALSFIKEEPLLAAEAFPPYKLAAIEQLSVDPSNARFMLLVDDLIRPESLPRGWTAEFKLEENKWQYTDKQGQKHDKHPVYAYYKGAIFMDQGGYAQLKAIAAAKPPTSEEIKQMGHYFKIKQDEDKYIWEVAEMGLCAPLPPGWTEDAIEHPGDEPTLAFKNEESGVVQQEHPLDDYFRELIRRRRRELLRRKKAAFKSLQALVRMGMGRRSLLAAGKAVGNSSSSSVDHEEDPDTDLDTFGPETQAVLQTAWQGLLGVASQLVHSMQAAAWDGSTGLADDAAPSTPSATATHSILAAASNGGYGAGRGTDGSQSEAAAAMHQRLQQLSAVLAEAQGPSADPATAASAALSDIERLAALTAAAGSDADALAALLAGRGIFLPDYASAEADVDNTNSWVGQGSYMSPSGRGGRSSQRSSGAGQGDSMGDSAGAQQAGANGSRSLSKRPSQSLSRRHSSSNSLNGDSTGESRQRRPSLLGNTLPFLAATGATASTAGAVSTSGAGSKPWCLAEGMPSAAGVAAGAAARGTAAARVAGADGIQLPGPDTASVYRTSFAAAFDAANAAAAASVLAGTSGREACASVSDAAGAAKADAGSNGTLAQHGSETARAAAGGKFVALLSLVHGSELPPAAEAAMQHLAALQAVMQQALGLIKSWQQQKVIIALLQQRLQDAATRASTSQHKLAIARQELQEMQAERKQGMASAAAVTEQCHQLAQQLLQAQQELAAAVTDQLLLQQRLDLTLTELAGNKDIIQKLQAESGSDAAAAAAEASALATAHQQLQEQAQHLHAELQTAEAAVATGQERCQQLGEQLAAVSAQLQQEQAQEQELRLQLQQAQEDYAALQAMYEQLQCSAGSNSAAASAELSQLKGSMQHLQDTHASLQQEHAAVLVSLTSAQDDQQQLQRQLGQTQQQLTELQVVHGALQAAHNMQGQQLQDTQQALNTLQETHAQQGVQLSTAQQELSVLQHSHAAALKQQESLQTNLYSAKAELAAMQAATKAAEAKRAAMPHKHTQVAAIDHADARWVHTRGVQTGSELDQKSTRDVGTPADLSLLSYFFREIKQKQRGGGGAILGYDPAEAANAAAGPQAASPSGKSWSGGTGLPPISASCPGARDTKSAASRSTSPMLQKRPATMPGNVLGRKGAAADEEEDSGFNTRPPSWEVRQKVDRRRDRAIKLERGSPSPDGDKWDYAIEERDAEIDELKRRLVEAEHRAKEAASKAAEELRVLNADLQSCKRGLEQAQADNHTLNKELITLQLIAQAAHLADGSAGTTAVTATGEDLASPRVSRFSAVGLPGARASMARVSTAPGAYSDAGLGLVVPAPRASVLMPSGGGQGVGLLGGAAGRVSPYGAGRLSALPCGVGGPAQFPAGNPAGQALSPYAANGLRKSAVMPPAAGGPAGLDNV